MKGGPIEAEDFSDPHFILGLKAFLSHLHFVVFKRMYMDSGREMSITEIASFGRVEDGIAMPVAHYDIEDFK